MTRPIQDERKKIKLNHHRWDHFNWITNVVVKHLTPAEFRLLIVYFGYAFARMVTIDGQRVLCDFVRMTDEDVAEIIGKSEPAIRKTRKQLIAKGLLRRTKAPGYGWGAQYEIANEETRPRLRNALENPDRSSRPNQDSDRHYQEDEQTAAARIQKREEYLALLRDDS